MRHFSQFSKLNVDRKCSKDVEMSVEHVYIKKFKENLSTIPNLSRLSKNVVFGDLLVSKIRNTTKICIDNGNLEKI